MTVSAEQPQTASRRGRSRAARWFEARQDAWSRTARELDGIERGKTASPAAVLAAIRAYPELARDLAMARREAPGTLLTQRLEQLYLQLHTTIFRAPSNWRRDLRTLLLHDTAQIARSLRWHIAWITLLFCASAAAGAWLVATYPELAALVASEQMMEHVERGQLWTDDLLNVMPSSVLAVSIFTNNVIVSLFAMCLGVLYGLGTVYIIGMNGFSIGAVFALTAQHGLGMRLLEFVVPHGFVELGVIMVAGAVGASLGEALARPGRATRAAAFQGATARGARLMAVCMAFMIGAGIIEGYVSPDARFAMPERLAVGLAYFLLFVSVMTGALQRVVTALRRRLQAA